MTKYSILLLAIMLIISIKPMFAEPFPDVPSITPVYTNTPPIIDGNLDDECWESAAVVTDFKLNTGQGLAEYQTIVRMLYDEDNFYIAMEAFEPEPEKLTALFDLDDEPVWRDDCVEVFIAPYAVADQTNFHHFVVNSLGKTAYLFAEIPEPKADQWQAATTIKDDRWIAEMAIPIEMLNPHGVNERFWRINFCRINLVNDEASSWSEAPGRFKSHWRFGKLLQPEDGPKFVEFRVEPQPIKTLEKEPAGAQVIKEIPIGELDHPIIIPEPTVVRHYDGIFNITSETRILVGRSDDRMDFRPAEEINKELQRIAGFTLPIEIVESSGVDYRNSIIVGERKLNPAADDYCQSNGIRLSESFPGKEGYAVEVGKDAILVSGCDQVGTFWGAQTLRQLIRRGMLGKSAEVSFISVRDRPKFEYRGVHLLATTDALNFHGRMIEHVFSRFKINNILLQCEHVEWDNYPEIRNPARAMPQADVRKLIEIANDYHITVTPLLQALGHMEWAFFGNSNLEMAEDPVVRYSYCPLSPKAHEFMNTLIDETLELFGYPEHMHMGLDEYDMRGEFPYHEECKRVGTHDLYINETIRLYESLKERGVRMMIWGDIMTVMGFRERIDSLPKDIIICDWRYAPRDEYPTVSFYVENGFDVIACTWFDPLNLYGFSNEAYKRGAGGMMQTTWTGFWPEERVMEEQFHQIHSYILGAEWAWTPEKPTVENLPYESDQVFLDLWLRPESKPVGSWFYIDLESYLNISLKDSVEKIGWLGIGEGNDLSGIPTGLVSIGGIPLYVSPQQAGVMVSGPSMTLNHFGHKVENIKVNSKANKLYFFHTTAFGDQPDRKAGEYVVIYIDGTTETIDLIYAQTISSWDALRPAGRTRSAWRGKSLTGETIRVNTFIWQNPHPEKAIASFDIVAADTQATPVLIAVTGEVEGE